MINAFLRNIEAQRLRERDEQMATLRGKDLPKHERGDTDADVRVALEAQRRLLAEQIVATYRRNPELSAWEIGKRLGTSHPTVLRELRKAGLK